MVKEIKKGIPKKYKGNFSGTLYKINSPHYEGYFFIAFPNKGFDIDEKVHEKLEGYEPIIIIHNINEEFILKAKLFAINLKQKKDLTEKGILEKILSM